MEFGGSDGKTCQRPQGHGNQAPSQARMEVYRKGRKEITPQNMKGKFYENQQTYKSRAIGFGGHFSRK